MARAREVPADPGAGRGRLSRAGGEERRPGDADHRVGPDRGGLSSFPMIESTPAVQALGLTKSFGRRAAVRGVDLALGGGECLALFGPNGAGKTTVLRLIAGLLKPTSGAARVRGVDVRRDAHARARVGLISHQSMLYAPLTVLENVEFSARLYGLSDPAGAARAALESMRVLDRADLPVRT